MTTGSEARAEALIAEIYRQKAALEAQGIKPSRVLLPMPWIRRLRVYRLLIGQLPDGAFDYLQPHSVFGLELVLHQEERILVE